MRPVEWKRDGFAGGVNDVVFHEAHIGDWEILIVTDSMDHRVSISRGDELVCDATGDVRELSVEDIQHLSLLRLRELVEKEIAERNAVLGRLKEAGA